MCQPLLVEVTDNYQVAVLEEPEVTHQIRPPISASDHANFYLFCHKIINSVLCLFLRLRHSLAVPMPKKLLMRDYQRLGRNGCGARSSTGNFFLLFRADKTCPFRAEMVSKIIPNSSDRVFSRVYLMSNSIISANVVGFFPLTCHKPVRPG